MRRWILAALLYALAVALAIEANANTPSSGPIPQAPGNLTVGPQLVGWVDLHAHPFSSYGFGGHVLYGGLDDNFPMRALATTQSGAV